jgi:streptogramin lyase/cytochrome c5
MSAPVDVAAGRATTVDVSLTDQRAPSLAAAWPFRVPGQGGGEAEEGGGREINLPDGAGKQIVLTKCSVCHDAARIASARYDRARWQDTIEDMKLYIEGASSAPKLTTQEEQTLLDYVAANFSEGGPGRGARRQSDPNSRLPRTLMTGLQRKYIAVEYVLPNPRVEPHEVASDRQGSGWVTQRTGGKLGRLDPVTYEYTEIAPPAGPSDKVRLNGIVTAPDGKLWFVDGGPNRRFLNLEPRTREFNQFPLPKLDSGSASGNTMRVHPNGTVWLNSIAANEVIRLDPKTRKFDVFEVPAGEARKPRGAVPYGMAIDGDGFVWSVLQGPNAMTRIDPNTGQFRDFPIPVQGAVARKAGSDSKGDIWAGLHGAGKLLKVDHKTFQMKVYEPPTKNSGVYSVQGDPKGKYVWMSQQHVDQIARFDPDTETFVEFPLPTAEEDHRRIDVDQNNSNRIWWSGNLTGRMGYIELLP